MPGQSSRSKSYRREGADLIFAGRHFKVKARAKGFRRLHRRLENYFGLVLSADRHEPLIVLRLGNFLRHCRFCDPTELDVPKTPSQDCGTGFREGSGYKEE